jgi:hypothetical protein
MQPCALHSHCSHCGVRAEGSRHVVLRSVRSVAAATCHKPSVERQVLSAGGLLPCHARRVSIPLL